MAGFERKYSPQFGGLYKTPAGKTTVAAGAGGAAPRAQAPGVAPAQDAPVDLSGLGGLLYWMGQTPEGAIRMDMAQDPKFSRDATPEQIAAGIASMSPEDRAAADASPFRVEYGSHLWRPVFSDSRTGQAVADPRGAGSPIGAVQGAPTYFDQQGRQIPAPDAGFFERMAYNLGKWF